MTISIFSVAFVNSPKLRITFIMAWNMEILKLSFYILNSMISPLISGYRTTLHQQVIALRPGFTSVSIMLRKGSLMGPLTYLLWNWWSSSIRAPHLHGPLLGSYKGTVDVYGHMLQISWDLSLFPLPTSPSHFPFALEWLWALWGFS